MATTDQSTGADRAAARLAAKADANRTFYAKTPHAFMASRQVLRRAERKRAKAEAATARRAAIKARRARKATA